MKKILFFTILGLSCYCNLEAQSVKSPITTYPKYYYGDGTNKPFDKAFDLMIPFQKQDSIYYIYLYKHRGNKSFLKSLEKEKDNSLPSVQLNSNWEKNKTGDSTFCKVEFRYTPSLKDTILKIGKFVILKNAQPYSLLKPSRTYSLIFFKGFTGASQKIINALAYEYKTTGNIAANDTAHKVYEFERQEQISKRKIGTYDTLFQNYIDFYKKQYYPKQKQLEDEKKKDSSYTFECADNFCLSDYKISNLLNLVNNKGCTPVSIKCTDTCNVLNLILSLYKVKCDTINYLLKGLAGFDNLDQPDKYNKVNKYEARKTSVSKSLSDINLLSNLILNLKSQLINKECKEQSDCLDELYNCLNTLKAQLTTVNAGLGQIIKLQSDLASLKIDSRLFIDYDITEVNSYVYNFQARNELAITPVFGYAYYGFQKGFNGFTPYAGFQINFQGVNRDDPYNQIRRKTIWQRMCFTTAWTLSGVQEANKRYDLFDKSSLITAIGFKLTHIVMLNAGTLWFKKEDPNALVTTKNIAATPVLALSVNLEIEKLLNGFTKLIPIK